MDSLRNKGLIRVLGGDGGSERVVITSQGMAAIGVEIDGEEAPSAADTAPTSAKADPPAGAAARPTARPRRGQASPPGARGRPGQPSRPRPHPAVTRPPSPGTAPAPSRPA